MKSDRLYLYVPPEEKGEVQALGASWDAEISCWYIGAGEDRERFSAWLPEPGSGRGDEEFSISSEPANVPAATFPCGKCASATRSTVIYAESGPVLAEPLPRFRVRRFRAIAAT